MDTWFADVIIPLKVSQPFTYRLPNDWNGKVKAGQRILVPFGKSKYYTAVVLRLHKQAPLHYTAKYAEMLLDLEPVLTEAHLKFWLWMAHYYMCTPGDVMQAALPAGLKLSTQCTVHLHPEFDFEQSNASDFSVREHALLDILHQNGSRTPDALAELLAVKTVQPILKKLLDKKAVYIEDVLDETYKPLKLVYLQWHPDCRERLEELHLKLSNRAPQQAAALLQFNALKPQNATAEVKKSALLQHCTSAAIKGLLEKKILQEFTKTELRLDYRSPSRKPFPLSSQQQGCIDSIQHYFKQQLPVLLHGVTGSGKTEIYIHLIQSYLNAGAQVLYLIPEIALTTQLIERLSAVFGTAVGVYHSRFNTHARTELWHQVGLGSQSFCRLLVGARSSVFLPFKNLQLIIVDEEHDASYKQQDPAPRYQARDVAFYLARLYGARLLLGSATPSAESRLLCQESKMAYVRLNEQYASGGGNQIHVCDLTLHRGQYEMDGLFTPDLKNAIHQALAQGQQVLLFQNRRGLVPLTECRKCGYIPQCSQCDVSLIRHKSSGRMHCHYCGLQSMPPSQCPTCASQNWSEKGFGTERVEEDVQRIFPQARVGRMDQDSTRSRQDYLTIFEAFASREMDILIGTQMVSKGLDFKHLSVVGVLNADGLWQFPEFRSQERAYQTLVQVKGRAGRMHQKGQVFIQTTQPEHPVIQTLRFQTEDAFYAQLFNERSTFGYPPFTRLLELTLKSTNRDELEHLAGLLGNDLKRMNVNVLGPETPLVGKIKNHHLKRFLIKWPRYEEPQQHRQKIWDALDKIKKTHARWNYRVELNVDPV